MTYRVGYRGIGHSAPMALALSTVFLGTAWALPPPDPQALAERAAYAREAPRSSLATPAAATAAAVDPFSLADALDLPVDLVLDAQYTGDDAAVIVAASLGVINPVQGSDFVILSSGIAGTNSTEPGVDLGAGGTNGDSAILRLVVDVPDGTNRLSLSYQFLSSE